MNPSPETPKPTDQTPPAIAHPAIHEDILPALAAQMKGIEKEVGQIVSQMNVFRAQDDITGLRRAAYRLEDQLLPQAQAVVAGAGRDLAEAHMTVGLILRGLGRQQEAGAYRLRAHELTTQANTQTPPDIFFLCDEAFVTDLACSYLRRKGYASRSFDHTQVPLLLNELRAASPRPRLLIAKGRVGKDAVPACREIEPRLKVLGMSGTPVAVFGDLSRRKAGDRPIADEVLQLPFSLSDFGGAVQRLIGDPRPAPQRPLVLWNWVHQPTIFLRRTFRDECLRALVETTLPNRDMSMDFGLGFRVLDWSEILKVLAVAKAWGHPTVLLARTEVVTGKVNGEAPIVACRKIDPAMKVIVQTTYPQHLAKEMLSRYSGTIDAVLAPPDTKHTVQEWSKIERDWAGAMLAAQKGEDPDNIPLPPAYAAAPTYDPEACVCAALQRLFIEAGYGDPLAGGVPIGDLGPQPIGPTIPSGHIQPETGFIYQATMTPQESFLQRCKTYTFPRSAEVAVLIEAGAARVMDGCVVNPAVPAAGMLELCRSQLDRLASFTCPEAEAYRREIAAFQAKLAERPQDRCRHWSVIGERLPRANVVVDVYEWESDQGFIYGAEGFSPARVAFALWQWDHPNGVDSLVAPWDMLPDDHQISILWRSGLGQDIPEDFMHAFKHMSREDRSRWCKLHPTPPLWRAWMEPTIAYVERLEKDGLLPEKNPWIEMLERPRQP